MLLLIPLLPFAGFLFNASLGRRLGKRTSGGAACAAMIASFAVAALSVYRLAALPPGARVLSQTVYSWITSGSFDVGLTLRLDPLSSLMILIVTGVGSLIHV